MEKNYSINYTKVARAESLLFDAKKRIREIDSPLPGEIWGVMEDLDKVTDLLREYLSEDNLVEAEE